MSLLIPILIACGISAGVCLVVATLARVFGGPEGRAVAFLPFALAIGYAAGHAWLRGWVRPALVPIPPIDAYDWIPWLALAAMILGGLDSVRPCPGWARWENRLLLTALTLWLLLRPLLEGTWSTQEAAQWMSGLGLLALAVWGVLDFQAKRLGRKAVLPLIVWTSATALCMQFCHITTLAQLGFVLVAGLAGFWIVSLWWPGLTLARGAVPVLLVVVNGLILFGRFYAYPELPVPTAIGLAIAPLSLAVDSVPPLRNARPLWTALLRLLALLVPVGVAVGFALHEFLKAGVDGY